MRTHRKGNGYGCSRKHDRNLCRKRNTSFRNIPKMAYGVATYPDSFRREDLLDIIKTIAPDRTPMMSKDTSYGIKRIEEIERQRWANKSAEIIRRWMKINTEK